MLSKALNKTATDDDWSALGSLGSHLNRTDPSFDSRTYGFAKLSDLVKNQPYLETRTVKSPSGQGQLWVRLKRRDAAKKAAKKGAQASAAEEAAPREAAPMEPVADQPSGREPALKKSPDQEPAAQKPTDQEPAEQVPDDREPDAEPVKKAAARRRTTRKVAQTSVGGV